MIKFILNIAKKLIQIVGAAFCAYLIFIILQDLNILIFHSYETGQGFERLYNRGFFDLDLFMDYSDHYWKIIAKLLVVIVLLFGVVIPVIIKIFGFNRS